MTPTSRRSRNQAFAIIAEPSLSRGGSRSPSPSGRVSPFRGRGFNPIGSRHASPAPSPTPPQDDRVANQYREQINRNISPTRTHQASYHPEYTSNSYSTNNNNAYSNANQSVGSQASNSVFGEKIKPEPSPRTKRRNQSKLSPQLSKSLTNISSKVSNKPPPSPRRHGAFSKAPAFQQLSPITGSSPESDHKQKSKSSSSKIPRSRSQPPSRKASPSSSRAASPASKNNSRAVSRNNSRNPSRSQSPTKGTLSPTKTRNKYSNVQPKVNSFNKLKPKVPPKPHFDSEDSVSNETTKRLERKSSVLKDIGKTTSNKNNSNGSNSSTNKASASNSNNNKNSAKSEKLSNKSKINSANAKHGKKEEKSGTKSGRTEKDALMDAITKLNDSEEEEANKHETTSKASEGLPSTTTVVSSTTTTATQPLKIEAKMDLKNEIMQIKPTPMYMDEGRVLNATSVSSAINRMNDTVLNSQTLMKDHNFTKLSPAANAIISMSNEATRSKLAFDPKSATTALPTVETVNQKFGEFTQNINNNLTDGNKQSNHDLQRLDTVRNNINRMISPDHSVGLMPSPVQKSGSNGLDGRTVITKEVKPIRITVKEKPMDPDVQSGNVRMPGTVLNGISPEIRSG